MICLSIQEEYLISSPPKGDFDFHAFPRPARPAEGIWPLVVTEADRY
jgi:hypothetical protein